MNQFARKIGDSNSAALSTGLDVANNLLALALQDFH